MESRQLSSIGRLIVSCVVLCVSAWSAYAGSPMPPDTFEIPEGEFVAEFIEDKNHITVMRFVGDYNMHRLDNGEFNVAARAVVAKEFYEHHPDNYDFLVVFTDFEIETGDAVAFYSPVKNDVQGIGLETYNSSEFFGSGGRLRGGSRKGDVFATAHHLHFR